MGYKTIEIENIEYYLVPKPIIMNLIDNIRIKFIKNQNLKCFKIELDGYHIQPYDFNFKIPDEYWTNFVRHEKEDGSYKWCDWANQGIGASDCMATKLENWYQKNIIS